MVRRSEKEKRWTLPYSPPVWARIDSAGRELDRVLLAEGVRLTEGGEPTFVAVNATDPQWLTTALGDEKRRLAELLLRRLQRRLAPDALLLDGVGKSYPGEEMPRWALGLYWLRSGAHLWQRRDLLAEDFARSRPGRGANLEEAGAFLQRMAQRIGIEPGCILKAYRERRGGRSKAAASIGCRGFVLPLLRVPGVAGPRWASCRWSLPGGRLFAGRDGGPLGLSLPLHLLPPLEETELTDEYVPGGVEDDSLASGSVLAEDTIRVAMCAEVRNGLLRLFLPPTGHVDNFRALLAEIEETAAELVLSVCLEGYGPPPHSDLGGLQITPDPGVLEVNLPATSDWSQLVTTLSAVAEEAAACGLGTIRFLPDGRQVGTGGGHHITLGSRRPEDSPFFRRPDLLRSLLTCWQNHPALSYGFSGLFVGSTSQAPRPDEVHQERLTELAIALEQLGPEPLAPQDLQQVVQRLLVDGTGNAHRTELCVDKLWPLQSPDTRLGVVELRGIEMQPHVQMDLVLALLVRTLVAAFWHSPYEGKLRHWGSALQDRFALPRFLEEDLEEVVGEIRRRGLPFEMDWLKPHLDFRFPVCGRIAFAGGELELRQALEPWPVLSEELSSAAATRAVDSSCERLQVRLICAGTLPAAVLCNGHRVPLTATERKGETVAAVRFKARALEQSLHPGLPTDGPLRFDILAGSSGRTLGGALYHAAPPEGGDFAGPPVDAGEAARRRRQRFILLPPGQAASPAPGEPGDPLFPLTLDLRRWP